MSNELAGYDETQGDEKTASHNIFLLKLELDDKNWVTVAVDINTKVKDVVAKVLKRPKIAKSTLCVVYNGAKPLHPERDLYDLMRLDPLGDNIFIVLISDDGTDEHKQAIYELFPDQVPTYKQWSSLKKKKKKALAHVQNRKTTKQFATDLHKFVSADIGGLDAVVFDMKSNEESAKTNFTNRVTKYKKRSDLRRGTITKLQKEINQHTINSTNSINSIDRRSDTKKNKYKKRDLIKEEDETNETNETNKVEEKELNLGWSQYLNCVRQQLSNEMWYWNSIESDITWPIATDISDDDKYIYERTLICQMQAWMRRYGMTAMREHEDIHELKKRLLKITQEADQLDEEVVQVTQQLFNMEHQKNELQSQLSLLNKPSSPFLLQSRSLSPRSVVPNKPLPELTHSKSQTMSALPTDELYNDHETTQITELQRKCNALQQSNVSLKKEVIEFKIYQKQARGLKNK